MNYPRTPLKRTDLYDGRRVYVGDLDVFGRVGKHETIVLCEMPMPDYEFKIADAVRPIYDDAIGDRDPE